VWRHNNNQKKKARGGEVVESNFSWLQKKKANRCIV